MTIVIIAGAWVQPHYGKWQGKLMSLALLVSMLGVFMSATRLNALILMILMVTTLLTGRIPVAYRFRYLIVVAAVFYVVASEQRLQRFTTLQDPEFLSERLVGSVNLSFLDLARQYPLGNGLGGGGTSVPYFLQNRIRNVVTMENEYARILLELGLPGLVMWGMFLLWVFTRPYVRRTDMFYFGRRLAYVVCACSFALGLIGVGLFTSVPATTIMFLLTGWFVVQEVRFAPVMPTDIQLEPAPGAEGDMSLPVSGEPA